MAFSSQIWTLTSKNIRCQVFRRPKVCVLMALILPVALSTFFGLASRLLVLPATFGIGEARMVKTLQEAFDAAKSTGRNKVVLVNNGYSGGDIDRALDEVAGAVAAVSVKGVAIEVVRIEDEESLLRECRSTLRGVTSCFNAVVMRSSPTEGHGALWNYTIRTDGELANSPFKMNIGSSTNAEQVYLMPMQRTVDMAIARLKFPGTDPLAHTMELPFTSMNEEERIAKLNRYYHRAIINSMGVTLLSSVLWVSYHVTGFIATERESGMSQLLDATVFFNHPWKAQMVRAVSNHLSFSAIHVPGWIISSVILRAIVYENTNVLLVMVFHLLAGLAVTSTSIFVASFFNKSQISGISATLVILLLGIVAQSITGPGTATVATLSSLFTPCNYVFFSTLMARFELQRMPASLIQRGPDDRWQVPGIIFLLLLLVQILLYPLLAVLVERSLHCTSTTGRNIETGPAKMDHLGDNTIQLRGGTKVYMPSVYSRLFSIRSPPEPVLAINDLRFSARKGEIVALLGENGSGKSTTLDAIAGLKSLTTGSIAIAGKGGLGITPQKNVLWDDLTVEEHLRVFGSLKSNMAPGDEILELVKAIDLYHKRNALAKALSGGQKRKLQLGMMLAGGSSVCCVDEVSSGVDPLSRRKLWDILLAQRGKRTIVLTTHFLDEAEILADHIVILSKGRLRAQGSAAALKETLGGGYRFCVRGVAEHLSTVQGIEKQVSVDSVTYIAPSSSLAARVIGHLDAAGIADYKFSGPTIEDVFLNLNKTVFTTSLSSRAASNDTNSKEMRLSDGKRVGYVRQARVLFAKRCTVLKRDWMPYCAAVFLPIFAAGLTSLYVKGRSPAGCSASEHDSAFSLEAAFKNHHNMTLLAGPPIRFSEPSTIETIRPAFSEHKQTGDGAKMQHIQVVDTYDAFQRHIHQNYHNTAMAIWLGDDTSPPTIGWMANLFIANPLTAQQILDMLLTNTTIASNWAPFNIPFNVTVGNTLKFVIYMSIAFSCYPAFFGLYPSNERRGFVRELHYSSGVRPLSLWAAYAAFDLLFCSISAAVVLAIWFAVSRIWFHLEYLFAVLVLYGLASALFSYVVSLFTKSQLATFAWVAASLAVSFLCYLIAYFCVVSYIQVSAIDSALLVCHFIISAVTPMGSVARALFVTTNLFSAACDETALSTHPADVTKYGGPILILIFQSLVFFFLLVWLDSGCPWIMSTRQTRRALLQSQPSAPDAEMTREATDSISAATTNGLQALNLTKSFGKNTVVDNVSVTVKRDEVFALLGPNGAGKSTILSLLRGHVKPDRRSGNIFIDGVSLTQDLNGARASLGICLQEDAIDRMTVREHLEFYARVRGVTDVQHDVSIIISAMGLEGLGMRCAQALSGGNKRKLSLSIALMGNPRTILLDEPSSRLDVAAKRAMWTKLSNVAPGRSLLLTTHSMEEVDALATRAGILAQTMLAVGTPDELRGQFGDVLHVHLVSGTAPRTADMDMQRIVDWVIKTLPTAAVDAKTHHGQIRFCIRAVEVPGHVQVRTDDGTDAVRSCEAVRQSAMGSLIVLIEAHKEILGVSHYSVSPTTLDQAFLKIVGEHDVARQKS